VHGGLRKLLTTNVRIHMNHLCRSCTASNCKELAVQPDLNGFLVSGASLKVKRNTNILE
ncbi:Os03g0754200, partial [Oryza sativa Japonica Group]|jgi:triosephosphate isomerase